MSNKNKNKKLSYQQRQNLTFIQPNDPPFLAKMKQKMGFRETKIEDKFNQDEEASSSNYDDDIRTMCDEDRPQILVINPKTDISSEQLDKEIEQAKKEEDRKKIEEGKIVFRKPEKRPISEKDGEKCEKIPRISPKIPCNKKLLSFGDEEE